MLQTALFSGEGLFVQQKMFRFSENETLLHGKCLRSEEGAFPCASELAFGRAGACWRAIYFGNFLRKDSP